MTKLYIQEFDGVASTDNDGAIDTFPQPPVATQVVDYTGGATPSVAFNARTQFVEIHTDAICSILFGATPVATTSSPRMAANETRKYGVVAGQKVSAITNT